MDTLTIKHLYFDMDGEEKQIADSAFMAMTDQEAVDAATAKIKKEHRIPYIASSGKVFDFDCEGFTPEVYAK